MEKFDCETEVRCLRDVLVIYNEHHCADVVNDAYKEYLETPDQPYVEFLDAIEAAVLLALWYLIHDARDLKLTDKRHLLNFLQTAIKNISVLL